MIKKIKELIKKITPLNRYNVSPGLDQSLAVLKDYYPELTIHSYKTGEKIWDWVVPEKWELKNAELNCEGKTIFSHLDYLLRVWSGSWPTRKTVSFNELKSHLLYDEDAPNLLPWRYKYYYIDSSYWGFSLTKDEFENLDKNAKYEVVIESRFYPDDLRMGTIFLPGKSEYIFIISSHICHPGQANDGLSGVACTLYVYEHLKKKRERYYSYLFTFQPEMIGTIAFLANNEHLIEKIQYGIFSEMMGTPRKMVLQHSLSKNTRIDIVGLQVLFNRFGGNIESKDFLDNCIINDELVLNHVGIHVPTIALNRGTFHEYHTSGDNFDILNFNVLKESADTMLDIILAMDYGRYKATQFERIPPRISFANRYEANKLKIKGDFVPEPLIKGMLFLSKHGLYVDWQENPTLNRILDKLLISINGVNSCLDIAKYCGVSFSFVADYLQRFEAKGLIRIKDV